MKLEHQPTKPPRLLMRVSSITVTTIAGGIGSLPSDLE